MLLSVVRAQLKDGNSKARILSEIRINSEVTYEFKGLVRLITVVLFIRMCSRTALLLLIGTASVLLTQVTRPGSDECYFVVNVPGKRMVSFANINWPDKYSSGEICQWIFHCPSESVCRLRCPDVGLPKTDDCYMDKLLVYSKGTPTIGTTKGPSRSSARQSTLAPNHTPIRAQEHARMYCGRTTINVRSSGTKIAMVLISNEASPGGRFRCTVTPEKVVHKAWRPRSTPEPTTTTSTVKPVSYTERYDASY